MHRLQAVFPINPSCWPRRFAKDIDPETTPTEGHPVAPRRGALGGTAVAMPGVSPRFFPQSAAMGCAVEVECSPAVEAKVVVASTRNHSHEAASAELCDLAELEISAKRCARITQRIGQARLGERRRRCAGFQGRTPPEQKRGVPADAPANGWEGRVAAVIVDGGRAQMRDERWGTPKQPREQRNWWREPKSACLTTFQSRQNVEDPLPEIPACLLDPLFVIPRVLEMKRTRAGTGEAEKPGLASQAVAPAVPPVKPERWSPRPRETLGMGLAGRQSPPPKKPQSVV
jgi:hypothetical protein